VQRDFLAPNKLLLRADCRWPPPFRDHLLEAVDGLARVYTMLAPVALGVRPFYRSTGVMLTVFHSLASGAEEDQRVQ
jgi:hypothetical protein